MPKIHLPPVHPEHVIAYSIVHHPRSAVAHRPILAIGALEVELGRGTDVQFTRHQKLYAPEAFPHPMQDILNLVRKDTFLVSAEPYRAKGLRPHFVQHRLRNELLRYGLITRDNRPTHIVGVQERLLRGFAGDFAFTLASPGDTVRKKAKMAADRAQAIWLTWSFECLRADPDYNTLMAAFRAWRILDNQHKL